MGTIGFHGFPLENNLKVLISGHSASYNLH